MPRISDKENAPSLQPQKLDPLLHPSWKALLEDEFGKPYFFKIKEQLQEEKAAGKVIFPRGGHIFNAFNTTPFQNVKVVILGQDPYHGPGQAHGLSFSVPHGIKPPPSLMNIFKELAQDRGYELSAHGNLEKWAQQGVFLLNAFLTVRSGEPASHRDIGWHYFTDRVIHVISEKKKSVVFMLWGKFAQEKAALIDSDKHLVLKAAHPSPFSAHNGFFGCRHFSKANEYLTKNNLTPIDWQL